MVSERERETHHTTTTSAERGPNAVSQMSEAKDDSGAEDSERLSAAWAAALTGARAASSASGTLRTRSLRSRSIDPDASTRVLLGDFGGSDTAPVFVDHIRVFLSSTFSDTGTTRNFLMEHVWPDLRRRCRKHGLTFEVQ